MAQVERPLGTPALHDGDAARRFLPPPGVHPNGAVFGAARLPKPLTWQRREHMVQRRSILGRIGQLLARNAQLVVTETNDEATAKTWALARKLEVLIFLNSASLLEYNNIDSLARRVQAMTASIVNKKIRRETVAPAEPSQAQPPQPHPQYHPHQALPSPLDAAAGRLPAPVACRAPLPSASAPVVAAASPMPPPLPVQPQPQPQPQSLPHQTFTEMMHSATLPAPSDVLPVAPAQAARPIASSSAVVLPRLNHLVQPSGKRSAGEMRRRTMAATAPTAETLMNAVTKRARLQQQSPVHSNRLGQLLFQGFDELNKMVWSYVDGAQLMRSRAVSRAARALAPLFVTSLQLSCNATLRALHTFSFTTGACILRECVNLQALEVVSLSSGMTFGKLSMRAMNCPQRFVVTHDDHEQIVRALSQQLRYNAFPRLSRLGLTCLFTNEEADGEADVLLNNLMTGCCPQLEELCLPGNSVGDYGAIKIAQMLRAGVCPKLTRLDLRRNFVSEEGIRSVCHALADGCALDLVELCLGGNTITDSCFHHVLFAMESRKLPHLRFLGIEMNYLTATSMEMLGRTIGKMVCPLLSQISYSDNSVDNADAKRLIATAVYQERMFRMRQQQLRHQQRRSDQHQHQQQAMLQQQQQLPQQQYTQPIHATMFPYTHEFPPASSLRGTSVAGSSAGSTTEGGAYFSEVPYSSGDDDEPYSSDGE